MSDFLSNFFGKDVKSKSISKKTKTINSAKKTKPINSAKKTKIPEYKFEGVKKSSTEGKKYDAIFLKSNGTKKLVSFGKSGEKDYTQHKDKDLKEFFDFKYKSKQNWKDLMHPQALNKWILWDKPSLDSGVSSYKRMFKEKYN